MVEMIDFVAHILRLHLNFCSGCLSTFFVHSRGSSSNRIIQCPSRNNAKWVNIVSGTVSAAALSVVLICGILELVFAGHASTMSGILAIRDLTSTKTGCVLWYWFVGLELPGNQ